MTCITPTWIWKGEHTLLVDATVAFTGYNTTNQTVSYTINLPWGDTRDLSLHINEKKEYADPYSNMVWSIVASVYDNIEDRVKIVCCHEIEQLEATDVLTLYFKPWQWTDIDGTLASLASKSVEIGGELANVLSSYTGYEYVTHRIEYRTPEGRTKQYVAMDIYLNDPTVDGVFALPVIPLAVIVKLSIIFLVMLSFGLFVFAVRNKTEETNQTAVGAGELVSGLLTDELEEDGDDFVSGEITPEEYTGIKVPDMLRMRREQCAIFKTDISIYNRLESCVTDALNVFEGSAKTQSDIVTCRDAIELCNTTFNQEYSTWMDDNYGSSPWLPDMDTFMEDMLKYAKYGLLALGAIMLAKAAID